MVGAVGCSEWALRAGFEEMPADWMGDGLRERRRGTCVMIAGWYGRCRGPLRSGARLHLRQGTNTARVQMRL
jgi:hypothetical protein